MFQRFGLLDAFLHDQGHFSHYVHSQIKVAPFLSGYSQVEYFQLQELIYTVVLQASFLQLIEVQQASNLGNVHGLQYEKQVQGLIRRIHPFYLCNLLELQQDHLVDFPLPVIKFRLLLNHNLFHYPACIGSKPHR